MILDQYGREQGPLYEGAARRTNTTIAKKDIDELVPLLSHERIVAGSRRLYANVGDVRAVVEQKAQYSVGRAWVAHFEGSDREWGEKAAEELNSWLNHADISRFNDWVTILYLCSVEMDRDGDAFILLTENKAGYPQIQLIPSNRIGQRDQNETVISKGKYRGHNITKGIITDKNTGRALAYRYLDPEEKKDRDIPANSMIHMLDPQWVGQKRGLPLFSSAINTFRDLKTAAEREQFAQIIMSSIVLAEHTADGLPSDPNSIMQPTANCPTNEGITVQHMDKGLMRTYQAGSGSKIEEVVSHRPSVEWQSFQDRLLREACVGVGWSVTLLEGNMSANGPATRLAIKQAEKAVEDRQGILDRAARRISAYAIGKFMQMGILPPNNEFWKWRFSIPKKMTIDVGRDSAALINEYDHKFITLAEVVGESGKDLLTHVKQVAKEEVMLKQARKEAHEAAGLPFEEEPENLEQ